MSSYSHKPVIIVSATRGSAKSTKLWNSPIDLAQGDNDCVFIQDNKRGLSTVYNEELTDERFAKSILVFVHDDVSIEDAAFARKIRKAHESYNVVGLAGGDGKNMYNLRIPPLWHIVSENKSGIVAHTTESDGALTSVCFGPTPRPVKIIDGLFMSIDVENCKGLTFDEDFDFHLYDLALCAKADKLGLTIGTWPIWVIHDGIGDSFRSQSWMDNAQRFGHKYRKSHA